MACSPAEKDRGLRIQRVESASQHRAGTDRDGTGLGWRRGRRRCRRGPWPRSGPRARRSAVL